MLMPYSEKAVRKMEREIPAKAARAVKAAYKATMNAGYQILIVSDGVLYSVLPGGGRTAIRSVPKRTVVPKGTKIKIR